jgi:hypothetical protein
MVDIAKEKKEYRVMIQSGAGTTGIEKVVLTGVGEKKIPGEVLEAGEKMIVTIEQLSQ